MTPQYVEELRRALAHAAPLLAGMSDEAAATRPGPGRWSPKEIVGHLIDSAANNHQRFVRGQLHDALVFQGYAQEDWVRVQAYQEAPWSELVLLWRLYNQHLARLMEAAPEEQRTASRAAHNLSEIGFAVPDGVATLEFVMRDYVAHLRHHLRQLGVDLPEPRDAA
jgi:hypothetical protein